MRDGMGTALDVAREAISDWLEAGDQTARFVFGSLVIRSWEHLTPEEREALRVEVEPKIVNPLRADEWSRLPH